MERRSLRALALAALLAATMSQASCASAIAPISADAPRDAEATFDLMPTATMVPKPSPTASATHHVHMTPTFAPTAQPGPIVTTTPPVGDATMLAPWQRLLTNADGDAFGGVAVGPSGEVYATVPLRDKVVKLSADGSTVTEFGGRGSDLNHLHSPLGIAVDAQGSVYIADSGNSRILKLSSNGEPVGQIGKRGEAPGEFAYPEYVTVDAQGNLYVADAGNYRVQKLTPSGKPIWQVGRRGEKLGQFEFIGPIAVDGHGNVYVVDVRARSARLQKLSPEGQPLEEWDLNASLYVTYDENCLAEHLAYGVGVDSQDSVFVADFQHGTVLELSPEGEVLNTWGSGGDAGPAFNPNGLAVDRVGNVYVSDLPTVSILRLTMVSQ